MAHFAKIDENNIVIDVVYADDKFEGQEEQLSLRTKKNYKQTSYSTQAGVHYSLKIEENGDKKWVKSDDQSKAFRKNFASIGFTYDKNRDAFIQPKIYNSWILDENTCTWKPPIKKPISSDVNKRWIWIEEDLKWQEQTFNKDLQIFENSVV